MENDIYPPGREGDLVRQRDALIGLVIGLTIAIILILTEAI